MTIQSCMSPKPLGSIYRAASSGVCMHQHAGACLHVFLISQELRLGCCHHKPDFCQASASHGTTREERSLE